MGIQERASTGEACHQLRGARFAGLRKEVMPVDDFSIRYPVDNVSIRRILGVTRLWVGDTSTLSCLV